MKKKIFLLVISLIIMTIILLKINKLDKKNNPPYEKYPFFKEELKDEYISYQKQTGLTLKKTIIYVNIGLNKPFYTNTKKTKFLDQIIMLVNKYNYLPRDYVPNNLVNTKYNVKLNKEAYNSFLEMSYDISKKNMNIRIISGYRSFNYQEKLYNKYLKNNTQEIVDTYSARPGYSEHQTGLVIDIDNSKLDYNKFYLTKEFLWMQQNAYKYGFILRYPKNKEKITGYNYEPWHYRYVGKDIAYYIQKNNITYEEYYYEFIDIKHCYDS